MIGMPGRSFSGPLPPLSDDEASLETRLRRHVEVLSVEIGERHVWRPSALAKSADYIEQTLQAEGYEVARQGYEVQGQEVFNLEVELRGQTRPEEVVVVGAHYDSIPDCPAANDNASGVAGVLELARHFRERRLDRTLRLVAFVNEEPPFFQGEEMGSLVYARAAAKRGDKIITMLSLETIGHFSDEPGSQQYPFPFSLFYPSAGNFIGFVGDRSSADLIKRCVASFRTHTSFPSEGAALPDMIEGIGWSDHWAFWQVGVPALMVTDTAPFRYAHYHEASDTIDKLDFARMARVVAGIGRVVEELAASD